MPATGSAPRVPAEAARTDQEIESLTRSAAGKVIVMSSAALTRPVVVLLSVTAGTAVASV